MIQAYARSYIENLKQVLSEIDLIEFEKILKALLEARNSSRQIFIIGNGGSAATATHFVCDLNKGTIDYSSNGFKRFKSISLSDNLSLITAIGNDISYDDIFTEQLKNYINKNDIVIGISASGNSKNIVKALKYAKTVGATTIGFLGFSGGKSKDIADYKIVLNSFNYGIVEDGHLILEHMITQIIRKILGKQKEKVIFLDRDGIINKKPKPHNYVTTWQEFEFESNIIPFLGELTKKGYHFIIVTNQQGIGKGIFTKEDLETIHKNMLSVLKENGIIIDRIYYCPHLESENCQCRKPNPGMLYKALNEVPYTIDIANSYFIGDSIDDMKAGRAIGLNTIFLNNNGFESNKIFTNYEIKNIKEALEIIK